jgi:membrane protein required for colicin V production
MIGPLSYLDAFFIVLAGISGLLAMYRGFTREVLTIASWGAAAAAVYYFVKSYKSVADGVAQQLGTRTEFALIGIGALIFLLVLILVHLITARLADTILDSPIGLLDRLLGFGFGVVRAFLVVLLVYTGYVKFVHTKEADQFPWVRDSLLSGLLKPSAEVLHSTFLRFVPTSLPGSGEQQG